MKETKGELTVPEGARFALVASRFNEFVTTSLVEGARDALVRHGAKEDEIELFWTPGSFEIPPVAKRLANSGGYSAVVCLGAVIRGSTPHFEYIASQVARGVASVAAESPVPVTFGVLTTDTVEQAIERSGTKAGNKGFDAAVAAIELVNLYGKLNSG